MIVNAPSALRTAPTPTGTAVSAPTEETTLAMQGDSYQTGYYPAPRPGRPNGGMFGWIGEIVDGIVNIFNPQPYPPYNPYPYPQPYPPYNPYPYPSNPGGYIPPEPAYGRTMMNLLGRYDQQQMQLSWQRDCGMPNQLWARYEQNLWRSTCDQIVRSWTSREEKLGALAHVLNSSTMSYGDFQYYANRVGGYRRW